jgi:hypothetical protein
VVRRAKQLKKELALNKRHTVLSREDVGALREPLDRLLDHATYRASVSRRRSERSYDRSYYAPPPPPPPPPAPEPASDLPAGYTRAEFNALLKALHPDRAKSLTDAERNEALRIILSKKPA